MPPRRRRSPPPADRRALPAELFASSESGRYASERLERQLRAAECAGGAAPLSLALAGLVGVGDAGSSSPDRYRAATAASSAKMAEEAVAPYLPRLPPHERPITPGLAIKAAADARARRVAAEAPAGVWTAAPPARLSSHAERRRAGRRRS